MNMGNRTWVWIAAIAIVGFIVDRVLKYASLNGVTFGPADGGVRFELFPNPAIAFSLALPSAFTMWLIPPVLAGFVWFGVWLYRRRDYRRAAAAGLVVVASMSNYLDRVQHGYVVDYVSFGAWFPVFNVSDWMIVAGLIILIVQLDGHRTTR